jgi:hypothetical protein
VSKFLIVSQFPNAKKIKTLICCFKNSKKTPYFFTFGIFVKNCVEEISNNVFAMGNNGQIIIWHISQI